MRRTAASTSASDTAGTMTLSALASVQIFEAHPDAHWLVDETGLLQHANRAALRLMGNLTQLPSGANVADFIVGGATQRAMLIR